jgi:hypothetical protein
MMLLAIHFLHLHDWSTQATAIVLLGLVAFAGRFVTAWRRAERARRLLASGQDGNRSPAVAEDVESRWR